MSQPQVFTAKEFKANPVAALDHAEQTSVIITKGSKKFAMMEVVEAQLSEHERKLLMDTDFESSLTKLFRRIRHHCFF